MLKRIAKVTALTGAGLLVTATAAIAHNDAVDDGAIDNAKATHGHDLQHGADSGHLTSFEPGSGLELKSELALKNAGAEKIADVGVLGDYAYLGAWGGATCKYNGVHVVDIADVENPEEVAFIPSKEGSYPGEGVQALHIDTPAFDGDILVTNNEQCKPGVGFGGMNIYDVSNPEAPNPLALGFGDDAMTPGQGKKDAHETHSVFAWDAGDRAYAVMVDNEEAKDVDIVDITNPKKPVFVAEYDLSQKRADGGPVGGPIALQAGLPEVFLHDMVVKNLGTEGAPNFVMLLSYWDGGYVQLDVNDPKAAAVINDSDFTDPDPEAMESGLTVPPEGNAHQAEYTRDSDFILAADEDFSPYALEASSDDDGELLASQGSNTKPLEEGSTITGVAKFVGRACNGDAAVPAGDGTQIAVVERGLCTFTEKVANVVGKNYAAILIFNRTGSDGCDGSLGMSVAGDIPTFGVAPRGQGFRIFDRPYDNNACLAGTGAEQLPPVPVGTLGDTLTFSSYFDGWGYVHLFDRDMNELDTYAVDEAHDPTFASGSGDLSVHEVATSAKKNEVAYLSYYSAGLRVVEIVDGKIVEKAAHIDQGGNNFWGVEVFQQGGKEYVAASDRDKGLYIYEYAPANQP